VIRRLTNLVLSSLAFWVVAGGVAYFLQDRDPEVFVFSGTAWLICLLPGLATLIWASLAERGAPDQLIVAGLGAVGVRMFFVAGVGMLLRARVSFFQQADYWTFWGWILAFYLFMQTVELLILLRSRKQPETTELPSMESGRAEAPAKPM
jgi:hypothetical protein